MVMILEGKTLLVSGVGAGLGREVARAALRDGANVVLGARTESALEEAARELDPSGERVAFARTDITSAEDCAALVACGVERFGGIDSMVQVAAYEVVFGGIEDTDFEQWRTAFDTNVLGSLTLIRALVPTLKGQGGGSLVLVGSQSMYQPQLPQAGYAASKGGLLSAMYYLADELGPYKIRVNMVVPSWMWGPPVQMYVKMTAHAEKTTEDAIIERIKSRIPLGEIVPDEEVAEAAVLLVSDRTRCITGQTLMVNGGEMLR
jgi:NAD(P)-dependent dehydrogenase (short-subunit alcohol dehydrogenase family)